MLIRNVKVFKENGCFCREDICITDALITKETCQDREILDGEGYFAVPGLTDIHFHGCCGHDFCEGSHEAFDAIARYELYQGITTICPATMTLEEKLLENICLAVKEYQSCEGAELAGINLEGPFISAAKKGAQNGAFIRKPDLSLYQKLQEACGNKIKIVNIAPELDGAMEFISSLKNEVVISIAHTAADYDTAWKALKTGANHVTHLYNAMMPFFHRLPGVIGAACDDTDCFVELICDGIHIHPAAVRATFKMFSDNRIIFISDSMMATGLKEGRYSLGGQEVTVKGHTSALSDGTIAGSVTNLMDCVREAVLEMGIPLESAIKCAAVNSAKSIGIYDKFGSITPGKTANILLLDQNLDIKQIIYNGKALIK